ncbi:MAG: hypothetical protein ABR505_09295 [Actinomycetota bacterium]
MADNRYLAIYLNDHLAGAIAGHELAKRAAGNNQGTPVGAFLSRLADEIDEDRSALEDLMGDLGIKKDLVKDAAAWMAEKVGRLKLNGKLVGYSDLSRLIELEGLSLGVEGKVALWRNLNQVADRYPELVTADLEQLLRRAEKQREELEGFRQDAARVAL